MTDDIMLWYAAIMLADCPFCGQPAGHPCTAVGATKPPLKGRVLFQPHTNRITTYKEQHNANEPPRQGTMGN